MLHIHNSLTGRKEVFTPLAHPQVGMYVCGITVYDYCHVGHARVLVVFDVVARYLRWRGYELTYVRNITDIDDKILRRAAESGQNWRELASDFARAMDEDCAAIGVLPPDHEPRATGFMDEMMAMIKRLLELGYAYQADNGDVYYDVSRFESYGRLSGKRLEDLRAGSRVEVDEAKQDPLDFVLWKAAKAGEPGWDAPWGTGRPGWHIECSAMSTTCLGESFDIHGGGMDLKFPHHENEIAQSCAATGQDFARYWMHNGFVQIDNEKMSKSLGNFFTIRDVLSHYPGEVLRFFIVNSHYRSPLNYSDASLATAQESLRRLYIALRGTSPGQVSTVPEVWQAAFVAAMDDDFNTPKALAVLFDLAREINKIKDKDKVKHEDLAGALRALGEPLGILQDDPERFLRGGGDDEAGDAEIEALVQAREAARKARDFAEADRIRDELSARDIVLEDGPQGTIWRRG